jgi:hypothetical protein
VRGAVPWVVPASESGRAMFGAWLSYFEVDDEELAA